MHLVISRHLCDPFLHGLAIERMKARGEERMKLSIDIFLLIVSVYSLNIKYLRGKGGEV